MRTLVPELPRDAWVVLGGHAVSAVGSGLTLPFLLVYLHTVRGIDLDVAGLALATIAVASLAGNPIGGVLADRLGPRTTVVLGLLVSAAGAVAVTLVRSPLSAFGATALVGLGAAVTWPAEDSLVATVVRPDQRSSAFAMRFATVNAGFGVGGLLAAAIVDVGSPGTFVTLYLLDAASFLLYVPVLLRLVGDVRPDPGEEPAAGPGGERAPGGYRAVLRDRTFVAVWALTALVVTIGYGQYHSGFPGYATRPGGISPKALGLAFAANTLTVVVAQLVVLRLMAGRRRTRGVMLVCALWAATWAVTLLAGTMGGGPAAVATFALAMVLFAIGETLLPPTVPAMVNDLAPDRLRGRYNGMYTLAWTTGFMVGPLLAGLALDAGVAPALFIGLIAACGAAALGALRLERRLPAAINRVGGEAPAPAPDLATVTP